MAIIYQNPVYAGSCPDPFVLKYCGEYWAYCTGFWPDGRCFGVLRSRDLVHWQALAGALAPLPEGYPYYWAPEVTYANGRFYMYYSAGDELNVMQLRVAVAEHPAGPFVDSGQILTAESFAIDAHVFIDDDGAWHLFYATDFLEHSHIGTGTVRARLHDPFRLAEPARPVTRPRFDWHVYDPQRKEKGGVRWHTVEGSFVLKRKGRYYQMFSGGNWQNLSYGVSYAVSDRVDTPDEWQQVADGERVLPILRTLPGLVVGPGHNSVVRGPDNQQLICVYHRWSSDNSERQLAIDPLDWAGERMLVLGPTTQLCSLPTPSFADFFDTPRAAGLGSAWECHGGWAAQDGAALASVADSPATAIYRTHVPSFVAEVSLRSLDASSGQGAYGASLHADAATVLRCVFVPGSHLARIGWQSVEGWQERLEPLPAAFVPEAFHLLRVEADGERVRLALDERMLCWEGRLAIAPDGIALSAEGMAAAFAGFALTVGWQQLFVGGSVDPADWGWQSQAHAEPAVTLQGWRVENGALRYSVPQRPSMLRRGPALVDYLLVVNARLEAADAAAAYGFAPALDAAGNGPLLLLVRQGVGWALQTTSVTATPPGLYAEKGQAGAAIALPAGFDPLHDQQFRFEKRGNRLAVSWEGLVLGELAAPAGPASLGLYASGAASFEMVRVTALH